MNKNSNQTDSLSRKEKYRILCEKESTIPLFCRDWWLDATAGENNWDIAITTNDDEIIGALPYSKIVVDEKVTLSTPIETKFLGPWVKDTDQSILKRLQEKKNT